MKDVRQWQTRRRGKHLRRLDVRLPGISTVDRREQTMDVAELAELLHETSLRHGAFEAAAPPHNWWDWYAAYINARRAGSAPDAAADAANRYMAGGKHVGVPGGGRPGARPGGARL